MSTMLGWWLIVEVLGLAGAPLAATVFARLPDRGWALAKPLSLLLVGWLVWLPLSIFSGLPYSRGWIIGTFVVFALANAALLLVPRVRQSLRHLFTRAWGYVIAAEALFAATFAFMGWERSFTPAVVDTEKFMDVAFLASIWRAPHLPPPDPWLSGESINYYYFGHFLLATIAKVAGTVPAVAFNVGIALIFALAAVAIFAVAANLMSIIRARPLTSISVLLAGLAAVLLTLVAGNLAGAGEWWKEASAAASVHANGLTSPWGWWFNRDFWLQYDWWTPSRVIADTINEFPAFSFILADLHAHMLALPFAALAVALAFNILLADGPGLALFGNDWLAAVPLVATSIVIGGLYAINGWDLPTYLGLALLALLIQQWLAHERRFTSTFWLNVVGTGGLLSALCVLLYVPFYRGFSSPSQGVGLVPLTATTHTTLGDVFAVFGLPLFLVVSLLALRLVPLAREFARQQPAFVLPGLGAAALLALLTLITRAFPGWTLLWAVVVIVACTLVAWRLLNARRDEDDAHAADDEPAPIARGEVWLWCLAGTAVALILACEVFYLRDIFGGGDGQLGIDFRMNTVFKLYYQAWLLLGIISGPALVLLAGRAYAALAHASVAPAAGVAPQPHLAAPLALVDGGNQRRPSFVLPWGISFFGSQEGLPSAQPSPRVTPSPLSGRGPGGEDRAPTPADVASPRTDGGAVWRIVARGGIVLWIVLGIVLLGASAVYPVLATATRTQNFTLPRTLDGTAYMATDSLNMGDAEAIAWLNAHVQGDPVIVEAARYDEYTHLGRVSAFTGLPTLMGWGGHEVQWRLNWFTGRGDVVGTRLDAVTKIYTSTDNDAVLALLRQYSVRYVYVGTAERQQYPNADLTRFSQFLRVVYQSDMVTIYAVP